MAHDRFLDIAEGDEAEFDHLISAQDLDAFVRLTGDDNPLHVDDAYAATTAFKKRVVHGMLTASFISTMIGTRLPGAGALWYEQQLRFLTPVRIGERIRVWAKVKQKSVAQRVLTLETLVFGSDGRKVIEGEAKVKVLETDKEITKHDKAIKGAIIVTGASRGIGAATARELASMGHPVLINYNDSRDEAEEVVLSIGKTKGSAAVFQADVSSAESVQKMVQFAADMFGPLSGVVNNAASVIDNREFAQLSWDVVQKQIDVQIKGAFHLCQAVMPLLLEAGNGSIVNIGSIYADNVPPARLLVYSMVKSALVSFSRSLAVEYGPKGIRVNTVSPGMTETDLIASVPDKVKMLTKVQTPLRRLASPEDVAGAVGFLFSDKARHITGANIRVCGGAVMV